MVAAALVAMGTAPGGAAAQASARPTMQSAVPVYEFRHGRWFDGKGFRPMTFYTQYGVLLTGRPEHVDSVIDLAQQWVVPPFAEAHNHNLDIPSNVPRTADRYWAAGVFYVKNPDALPRWVMEVRGLVNRPRSVDVSFAMGGFTSPGGHPVSLVTRNVARGIWTGADGEGAFYYAVTNEKDLDRRWAGFLGLQPDFVKTYLLFSEEYGRRRDDPAYEGRRGLDPALLPLIVERAHRAGLRVTTHIESAEDFRNAVRAGVDEIAHLPGFRGDADHQFPRPEVFEISDADAQEAARRGIVVVTTLGNYEGSAPDSLTAAAHAVFRHNLSALRRTGVRVAVGSDSYAGVSAHEAMQVHDLGVFTNLELLIMWTQTTPATIFPRRKIGHLADGFEASFLVLQENPVDDFSATQRIVLRVKQGVILEVSR